MPPTQHIAQVYVQIDGQHLDPKYMANLLSVEVDDSLYLPDMFIVRLLDPGLEALQGNVFKLGSSIKISIALENQTNRVQLMEGEITAIEPDLNSTERGTLTCRGYDRAHRLHRVRKTKTYQNVSDSDVATQLASGAGLQAKVTGTSTIYPYLIQANQTDWEFLLERALRIGYRLFVEGKELHFEPPPASPPVDTSLKWGLELTRFQGRVSTIDQPTEVTVRGWDPKSKQAIVGQATSPSSSLQYRKDNGKWGGQAAQSAHSVQGKMMVVDQPVYSQNEANKVAQSVLDRMAANFIQADCVASGNPALRADTSVTLDGLGDRFNGKYLVTHASHKYSAKGYSTSMKLNGGGTGGTSVVSLLKGKSANSPSPNGGGGGGNSAVARGVMVGIVTNNQDAENLGRVKVQFPALGDNIESFWCRMASSMAGPDRGICFMPEAGDEVVVAFQNGDPNHGYVLGAVWNGSDKLPKPLGELVTGSQTIRRMVKTRVGHTILIDDTPSPGGITIIDKTGNNKIVINTQENTISVEAQSDIKVKSTTGKVTVDAMGDITLHSSTGNISIKADVGKVSMEGLQAEVKGTAGVNVTADAGMTSVKGIMVNIN